LKSISCRPFEGTSQSGGRTPEVLHPASCFLSLYTRSHEAVQVRRPRRRGRLLKSHGSDDNMSPAHPKNLHAHNVPRGTLCTGSRIHIIMYILRSVAVGVNGDAYDEDPTSGRVTGSRTVSAVRQATSRKTREVAHPQLFRSTLSQDRGVDDEYSGEAISYQQQAREATALAQPYAAGSRCAVHA
jgi:hypothetical protein